MTGHVLVVVLARLQRDSFRRLLVIAGQQGVDIVRPLFLVLREDVEDEAREAALIGAGLGQNREIRRKGAAIGRARRLLIGKGDGKRSAGRPGRSNISPCSLGPSLI
jgi:hypothetical protein